MQTKRFWMTILVFFAGLSGGGLVALAEAPGARVAVFDAATPPSHPLLLTEGGSAPLRYQFFGARTAGSQIMVSIHCSELRNSTSVSIEIQFFDFNTLQVGAGVAVIPPGDTHTTTARAFTITTDTALYEENLIIPVGNDLNQGLVQVFSSSDTIVCSAVKLDATSTSPSAVEPLGVRQLFEPQGLTVGEIFTGWRYIAGVLEAIIHCTATAPTSGFIQFMNQAGLGVGTSSTFTLNAGETVSVATAGFPFYREDEVVSLLGAGTGQGKIWAAFDHVECKAEMASPVGMTPSTVIGLAGTDTAPDLYVFGDDFESGDTDAWVVTIP